MEFDLPQQVVQGLAGAIKGLRLYPAQHPAIQRQFQTLQGNLYSGFANNEVLRLGLLEGTLFFEGMLFTDDLPAAQELSSLLVQLELDGLEFCSGLGTGDLVGLATLLEQRQRQRGRLCRTAESARYRSDPGRSGPDRG